MALIRAYRTDTGDKVWIPEHWLEHPRLGAPFALTPQQKAADRAAGKSRPATKTQAAEATKER